MPTSNVEVNLKFASDVAALQATIQQLQALKAAAADTGAGAQASAAAFSELQARLGWLQQATQQFASIGQAAQQLAQRGGALSAAYGQVASTSAQVVNNLQRVGAAIVQNAQSSNLDAAAVAKLNQELIALGRSTGTAVNALGPQSGAVYQKLKDQYNEFGRVTQGANQNAAATRNLGFAYGNLAARLGSIGPQLAASVTGFKGMGAAMGDATTISRVLISQMQATAATAIVVATGLGALIAVVGGLAVGITGLVVEGVKLNALLENTQASTATTLNSLAGSTYGGQKGALQASADAMADLQKKANALQVPMQQVLTIFKDLNAAATLGGASLDKQAQLYAQLSAAQSRLGVSDSQLISDTKALLNGRVSDNNQVALALDLSKQQVETARENGTITDLLISKTSNLANGYKNSSDNFDDAGKKMQASLQQLELIVAKPLMQPLIKAIQDVSTELSSSQAQQAIAQFGQWIGQMASGAIQALTGIINAIAAVELALEKFDNAARDFSDKAKFNIENATKFAASGADTPFGNNGDEILNQNAAGNQAVDVGQTLKNIGRVAQDTAVGLGDLSAQAKNASAGLTDLTKAPPVQAPPGGYPKGPKGQSQDKQDAQEMAAITEQLTVAQNTYTAAVEQTKLAHESGLTTLKQEQEAQGQAAVTYIQSLEHIKAELEAEKQKIQEVGTTHGATSAEQQKRTEELDAKIQKVNLDLEKTALVLQSTTFEGSFVQQMTKQLDQLSFTGQKAAQDLQSVFDKAFSSMGAGLTQLITGGKNFGQVMSELGKSVLQDLINIIAKMAEQYILQEAMSIFGLTSQTTAAATALATGKAIEAAYMPAAIVASIASYGAAATVGTVAVETAVAAGQAGGAFAEGGIVPGTPSHRDNTLIHAASGEGIVKTSSVNYYGTGMIHAMNNRTLPRFAEGGIVGPHVSSGGQAGVGTSSGGRPVHVNVFSDKEELAQHVANHPDVEHKIVRTMQKNRFDLRV